MDNFVLTEKGVVIKITNTSAEQVLTNDNGFISPTLKLSEESVHKDIIPAFKIRIPEYVSYGLINIAPGDSISFIVKKPNEVFYYIGLQDARMEGISISVTPVTDSVVLQDKVITPTTEEQIVTADEGYNGLGTVTVNAMNLGTKTITASDTYNAVDDGFDGYSMVTVNVSGQASDMNAKLDLNSIDVGGPTIENITEVSFISGMTQIPDFICYGMRGLQSIDLNSQLISIGSQAFSSTGITSLVLPAGVLFDGVGGQFSSCEDLSSITFLGNNDYTWSIVDGSTFASCYPSTINNCPDIPDYTFEQYNTNLTSLSFSNLTTHINRDFQGSSITQLTIPASVTSIDREDTESALEGAFYGCDALETITINKPEGSIPGAPWGAPNAQVVWTG